MTGAGRTSLISRVKSGDPEVHRRALEEVRQLGAEPMADLIRALPSGKNTLKKLRIYAALALTGLYSSLDVLSDTLTREDAAAREYAAGVLGLIGDTRAVEPLIRVLRSGPKHIRPAAKEALDKILRTAPAGDVHLICGRCFYRYKNLKVKRSLFRSVTFRSCPNCRSNAFPWAGIRKTVLVLDREFGDRRSQRNGLLTVNWLKVKTPFDYDEIRIENAGDSDVEELVMILINDMDAERRKRMPGIPVYLSPQLTLSPAKINLLKDNFELKPMEGEP